MAVITISRQYFSEGHEICRKIADKTGYRLYDRDAVFDKMLELGCPADKVKKFDEIKPGLLPSLSKYNDEYLYYLKTAVLSIADEGNCVIEGRGAYMILKDLLNHVSVRIFEPRVNRIKNAMNELKISEKQAEKAVKKADRSQFGFLRYYFDANVLIPFEHNLIVNAGISDVESIADSIIAFTKTFVTEEKEKTGQIQLDDALLGQKIVNMLRFIYFVDIDSMKATVSDKTIVLEGVASIKGTVDNAIRIINCEIPEYKVISKVRVVQGGLNER